MVVYPYSPTWEPEAGGFPVQAQPVLHREREGQFFKKETHYLTGLTNTQMFKELY